MTNSAQWGRVGEKEAVPVTLLAREAIKDLCCCWPELNSLIQKLLIYSPRGKGVKVVVGGEGGQGDLLHGFFEDYMTGI